MKYGQKKKCKTRSKLIEYQALRELRLELGMTLREASEKLELGPKGLGAIENGRVYLNKERIEEIVSSYGLTYLDYVRKEKIIEKEHLKKKGRSTVKHVLTNNDRRSYQKIITKECRVIKSMRRIKGISQDKASKLCGYSRPTIGHIENGRIELNPARLEHIVTSYAYDMKQFVMMMKAEVTKDEIVQECYDSLRAMEDKKLSLAHSLILNLVGN
tara:strand:- start:8119 stop:8763 length:645 start_codon:yes stop_codon:yes gene_type:complete